MTARIFCIANQKGGVGKTTTAVNLAAGIAAHGPRVLLVDLDPQGNATMGSGIDKRTLSASVYQVLVGLADLTDARQRAEQGGYDVLGANRELAGAEVELVELEGRETRLKQALALIESEYDFILIDCPPSLSLLTLNGLCAAHGVIIPMQCEYFALEGLADLVNTIKRVAAQPQSRPHDHRAAARDVRPAHDAAAAGVRTTRREVRRQGLFHHHSAQCPPGRSSELRHAGRDLRPRLQGGAGLRRFRRGDDRPHPRAVMFDPSGVPVEFRSRHDALAARLEDAGLTCSQPPQQSIYDGWLLRYSPGKAKRAKSVNAIGAGQLPS